jgi:YHS domain-containing protein
MKSLSALVYLAAALVVGAVHAESPLDSAAGQIAQAMTPAASNADKQGLMLRGYDPVSYFTGSQPAKGVPEFTATHDGVSYQFASAANRQAFQSNPTKYLPAYGGFCAMGAAMNKKLDGDPTLWRIVDGRLFLNVNMQANQRWTQDTSGFIRQADANWPSIKAVPTAELNAR